MTQFVKRRGRWRAKPVAEYETTSVREDPLTEWERPSDAVIASVRDEIRALFDPPDDARAVMDDYLTRFDGRFYEVIADEDRPYEITARDLLAATALSMPAPPPAATVRILGEDGAELSALLRDIPRSVDLWAAKPVHLDAATKLWRSLGKYPGFQRAPVRKSKLLAAKRPRLVPIFSREIHDVLGLTIENQWTVLRFALDDAETRRLIDSATPGAARKRRLSVLRRLDIVVWRAGKSMSDPGITRFG